MEICKKNVRILHFCSKRKTPDTYFFPNPQHTLNSYIFVYTQIEKITRNESAFFNGAICMKFKNNGCLIWT